jgi:eukaryotic-like serine/threonine-protein kinase
MLGASRTTRTKIDVREEQGGVVIRLDGPINEHFDRVRFAAASVNRIVIIDLDAVSWITSFGVREWMRAIEDIPKSYLAFINVRPIMLQQFNMVASFAGTGELLSFYAPYACPACNHSQENLIDLLALYPKVKQFELPPVRCEACEHESELDDLAENYLMYVASARPPDPPQDYAVVLHGVPVKPAHRPLRITKLVHGTVTGLMLIGDLDGRASLKRAVAGLEGTVAVSLSGIQAYDSEGLSRLRPLWEAAAQVLLVEAPRSLVQAMPAESWRTMKIFSLRTELQCAAGHLLRSALVQNHEIWRLIRGVDPLRCPSCDRPLVAAGLAALATAGALGSPPPETALLIAAALQHGRGPRAPSSDVVLDEPFGRYTLVELLGVGGMAEVFLARQGGIAGFEKMVVLKRILHHLARDKPFIAMFLTEARLAARIAHVNVVQIYDIGQIHDRHYIVMEYVQGWDLSRLLRYARRLSRPFPVHLAALICAQIASALDAAHSAVGANGEPAPIIHRDVSPHNVLASREGAIKLTDFGIAKLLDNDALTPTATLKGKLSYLAPEVALGVSTIDTRADLFPLGIILYELLTLRKMFRRASDYATVHALLHDPIPALRELRADVPERLNAIGLRALARDPEARYASARDLRRDLETFLEETGMNASTLALAEYVCQLAEDAAYVRDGEPADAMEAERTIQYANAEDTRRDA